jgi:hypothetical protein
MARFKFSALMFAFFGLLSLSTYFRFDSYSRPLHVLQNMIDTVLTAWLGDGLTALLLMLLGIIIPVFTLQKSYEARADMAFKSTASALRGQVYKPSDAQAAAAPKQPMFGKRN